MLASHTWSWQSNFARAHPCCWPQGYRNLSSLRGVGRTGLPIQCAVHRRPGNREQLSQVTDGVVTGVMHALEFLLLPGTEFRLPAAQLALSPGYGHAFTGTHPNQIRFKLS